MCLPSLLASCFSRQQQSYFRSTTHHIKLRLETLSAADRPLHPQHGWGLGLPKGLSRQVLPLSALSSGVFGAGLLSSRGRTDLLLPILLSAGPQQVQSRFAGLRVLLRRQICDFRQNIANHVYLRHRRHHRRGSQVWHSLVSHFMSCHVVWCHVIIVADLRSGIHL